MAITAEDYKNIKILEKIAEDCGFKLMVSVRNYANSELCLMARDNELPIYNRGAELQTGSVEELTAFLRGWIKHKEYLTVIGACTDKNVQRKENDYRNRSLIKVIKGTPNVKTPA